MKFRFPQYTYCIDTSAIIDIKKQIYPPDVFHSLSKSLDSLIAKSGLISPREVLKELMTYTSIDDEVLKWAKSHRKLFRELSSTQMQSVVDIMGKFLDLVDPDKTTPDADPFIVALAMDEGATVVTSEKKRGAGSRPKIPDVCVFYNVECISVLDFFRAMNWKF